MGFVNHDSCDIYRDFTIFSLALTEAVSFSGLHPLYHYDSLFKYPYFQTWIFLGGGFLTLGFISLLEFIIYFFAQPLFFGKDFDHFSKISSYQSLLSPTIILEKLWFIIFLMLPFLPLISRFKVRSLIFLLPFLPFVGIILVSGFDEMWKPLNYYGIIPTIGLVLLSIETLYYYGINFENKSGMIKGVIYSLLVCYSINTTKPMKVIYNTISKNSFVNHRTLSQLPQNVSIATFPDASLFLLQYKLVRPVYLHEKNFPDILLVHPKNVNLVSPSIKKKYSRCHFEISDWLIFCHQRNIRIWCLR